MIDYDLDNLPTSDEGRSELAIFGLLTILFGPVNERNKVRAASLILRHCAPKHFRNARLSPEETIDWLETLEPNEP